MNEYQHKLVAGLRTLLTQDPPTPWQYVTFIHVGGLRAIGYGEASDLLLIVSASGRSVIDCHTGSKLARHYSKDEPGSRGESWYKPVQLQAQGIGPLEGEVIHLAGLWGGGLQTSTEDGWRLELVAPDWPNSFILLHEPEVVTGNQVKHGAQVKVAPRHGLPDTVMVYGFSPTGNSFAVAYSDGVDLYNRIDVPGRDVLDPPAKSD